MVFDEKSALIVVDVQNDFAQPDGSLYVAGGEKVIGFINDQVEAATNAGANVVYSQDWHPEVTPHFEKDGGIWPVHCVADTPGAAFHPGLSVLADAIIVKKGAGGEDGYSAFGMRDPLTDERTSTGLHEKLSHIERITVVGLALDYCVKETALDGIRHGFGVELLADGTRPVNLRTGDGARAVAELVASGVSVA